MNYSICVSGAASGDSVRESCDEAYLVGKAIAESGHITTTGATVGIPYFAARGAHENGGMSIGFSPAASLRSHVRKYRLPIGVFDYVNFTGMNYVGRDIHLVQSSDAVITIGGRIGSMHEFTTALENHMPCGVLLGTGGIADVLPEFMKQLEEATGSNVIPSGSQVIYDDDPERLVHKVIKALDKANADLSKKELAKHEASYDALVCGPSKNGRVSPHRAG